MLTFLPCMCLLCEFRFALGHGMLSAIFAAATAFLMMASDKRYWWCIRMRLIYHDKKSLCVSKISYFTIRASLRENKPTKSTLQRTVELCLFFLLRQSLLRAISVSWTTTRARRDPLWKTSRLQMCFTHEKRILFLKTPDPLSKIAWSWD